jgi:hypothetical protein
MLQAMQCKDNNLRMDGWMEAVKTRRELETYGGRIESECSL